MTHDQHDETSGTTSSSLPLRLEPMMVAHLALTGDVAQHKEWRDRVETVLQADAVEREHDPETRALLVRDAVWKQLRITGAVGSAMNLGLAMMWMSWLIPVYAVALGFGWLPALSFLLPVPIAWKVGRRLFQRAALKGMRSLKRDRSLAKRAMVLASSMPRSVIAGFGFGFTLVFLQGLISAFMTPLPTLGLELLWDFYDAVLAGSIAGGASLAMAPLLARVPPK